MHTEERRKQNLDVAQEIKDKANAVGRAHAKAHVEGDRGCNPPHNKTAKDIQTAGGGILHFRTFVSEPSGAETFFK